VSEGGDTILSKYISMLKETKDDESGNNILGIRWWLWRELDTYYLFSKNPKYHDVNWKGVVSQPEILDYIKNTGVIEGFLHTDFKPVGGPRYHGNPIKGWHDWVQVSAGTRVMICQILIFLEVTAVYDTNQKQINIGKYALVYFVNQNVFGDKPTESLYGVQHPSFCIDENCDLVRGWAKKTCYINQSSIPKDKDIRPTIGISRVDQFKIPIVGIPDLENGILHSYLFLPPQSQWPDFFVQRMQYLNNKQNDNCNE